MGIKPKYPLPPQKQKGDPQLKIAFVGKHAAGKTFAAYHLYVYHRFKRMHLFGAVKRIVRLLYKHGVQERVAWSRKYDIYDALYKLDPEVHINHLLKNVNMSTNDIVVDDVRYINEIQALKENGFTIIRINMMDKKRRSLAAMRKAGVGAIVYTEQFNADYTKDYNADYSILNDDRLATRQALNEIVIMERKRLDKERTDMLESNRVPTLKENTNEETLSTPT